MDPGPPATREKEEGKGERPGLDLFSVLFSRNHPCSFPLRTREPNQKPLQHSWEDAKRQGEHGWGKGEDADLNAGLCDWLLTWGESEGW